MSANAGGRCLRCGTPYEPDDTVCYHCGAPIGETEGDTAPVKIVRVNAPPAQGAPVASAAAHSPNVPANAPLARQGEGLEVSTPHEVDLSRITVGSMPAVRPATTAPAPKQRGRRGARAWLVAVLAVALALAALAGALYARRATTTTAPPVAQQTPYADPAGRFHFLRPALWSVSPTANGVSLTDSGGTSSVTVAIVTPGTAGIPANISAAAYADLLARQQGGASPLGPLPPRQITGAQWEQREGQVTGADGAVRETLLLVTAHGGNLYVITCTSPVASFVATQSLVFDPLLGSFAFEA